MAYESDWCGIVTIKELVDEIKAAGFRTMRIPMSWHNHVSEDENYIHYDNSPNYMYLPPEYVEKSKAYVVATGYSWRLSLPNTMILRVWSGRLCREHFLHSEVQKHNCQMMGIGI